MKKALSFLLVLTLIFTLALGIFTILEQPVNATPEGHLLWDGIDGVFRCLGSPLNCDFTPPAQ